MYRYCFGSIRISKWFWGGILPGLILMASQALALAPQDLAGRIASAEGYMNAQQWDFASHEWRGILAQDPQNSRAHLGLATVLASSGLLDDAIKTLEHARRTVKDTAIDLALVDYYLKRHRSQADVAAAGRCLHAILQKDPHHAVAFQRLKKLLTLVEESERIEIQAYLQRYADRAEREGRRAYKEGRYQDASKFYAIMVLQNKRLKPYNDYAVSLLLAGQPNDASKIYALLKLQTEQWQILANSAMVYLAKGQTYHATKEMERAISHCSDDKNKARLYNNLGYIYEVSRKRSKARFSYEKAIELDPHMMKAQMNLGYIYQREREYDQAIALYKKLTTLEPNNPEVWNQLGFSYELRHKPKPALSAYKKALAVDSKFRDAYFNLGTLYKKLNKMDKATQAFKQMMELEFEEIERAGEKNDSLIKQATEYRQSDLFRYVDLFYSEQG